MTKFLLGGNDKDDQVKEDLHSLVSEGRQHHVENIATLLNFGNYMKKLVTLKEKDTLEISENITVYTTHSNGFYSQGFRYNRLIVGSNAVTNDAKIVVSYEGLTWTIPLVAGENVLNLPDGSTFGGTTTDGGNFSAVLIRSNRK